MQKELGGESVNMEEVHTELVRKFCEMFGLETVTL
jgi:hypothetical protein